MKTHKTKVLEIEMSPNYFILAVCRWNTDITSSEEMKVYVNYLYYYSQEIPDFDNLTLLERQVIHNKLTDFCRSNKLRLWSY